MSSTQPTRIIGLTGLEGAGKDTVAGILDEHHQIMPLAFASALRIEITVAWWPHISILSLMDRETKEQPTPRLALANCTDGDFLMALAAAGIQPDIHAPQSPRQIQRWWGTEYRRAQDESYWLKKMQAHIDWAKQQDTPPHTIVITDVRFKNEAELVRNMGGQIWRIDRDTAANPDAHASSVTGLQFTPEQTVLNQGDMAELERATLHAWAHAPLYWK